MRYFLHIILFTLIVKGVYAQPMTCPQDITAICSSEEEPPYSTLSEFLSAGGSLSGDFDESSFALLSNVSSGSSCLEIVTRTYRIVDAEETQVTCSQILNVEDTYTPVLSCPSNLDINEDISTLPPYSTLLDFQLNGGTVYDNCEIDLNSFQFFSELPVNTNPKPRVIRTYLIGDLCANTSTCEQYIDYCSDSESFLNITSCTAYTSPSGNHVWDVTGTYMDTISNAQTCDSIITIDLTIEGNIVTNSNDSGPGSLRSVTACAGSTENIEIAQGITQLSLSSPLVLTAGFNLNLNSGTVVTLDLDFSQLGFNGASYGILVENGVVLQMENLNLVGHNNNSNTPIIQNEGSLQLTNVSITQ